ncbi:hypothetical protein SAMN04487906_2942 [Zhouia amylolytica]|uniref:Adhesin domain-containing protein n=3 Tax=Zhouia amylolytica TaxID=376730 RepID=W2URA8_9FLAO|nr:hypothetical protein P278_06360 [Zhouia amylolytica AD3]SFT09909.1 hypothetical protein SAMN04487906_2942 [Zhouia amylolytica]
MLYKITLFLLLLPAMLLATNPSHTGKYTKEKKINKEYSVNANALLKVDNSYGNLYITTWNQNRIEIEVHIKTSGNNEDKVQKKLDEIDVDFSASNAMVSAKTIFKKSSGWNWSWGSNNVSMEINYTIKMPVTNSVDLSNDYGGINLDALDGVAKISCDYGKMNIGELNADNNTLSFDYTSKSTIGYMKSGKISADYSGYEIDKAGNLIISADYTTSVIGEAGNLEFSCDYGSIKIGAVNNLQANGDYLTTKIGDVHGNVSLSSDYGSIKIDNLSSNAGNVEIRSDYAGIRIGYDPNYHFDFNIQLEYAGLSGKEDLNMSHSTEKSTEKHYEGYYGSKGKNKLSINSDYGSVKLYKN